MPNAKFLLSDLPTPMVYASHRTIKECNEEFAHMFGYSVEELQDAGLQEIYPKFPDLVRKDEMWQTNGAGVPVFRDERILQKRDGSKIWCQVHGRSINDNDPFSAAIYCFQPLQRPVGAQEHKLTERQRQIVTLVAQGKTSQVIAQETNLSVRTVEAHRARIMRAVGVRNVAELISWFQRGQ